LGLPSLVVETASNQRDILANLTDAGALISLGQDSESLAQSVVSQLTRLYEDDSCLSDISKRALDICDGKGAQRVAVSVFPEQAKDGAAVHLRAVVMSDAEVIFQWQSMPETRMYANNPVAPKWPEHVQWLQNKIEDNNSYQYMVMHGDTASGVVRLDCKRSGVGKSGYIVSIFVDPGRYRLGLGMAALKILRRLFPFEILYAQVHQDNSASRSLFESAGYVFEPDLDLYVQDNARSAEGVA
jgi:RimJ/RimL family protein N-acetyltransferase